MPSPRRTMIPTTEAELDPPPVAAPVPESINYSGRVSVNVPANLMADVQGTPRQQAEPMVTLGLRVPAKIQRRWIAGCRARKLQVGPTGGDVLAAYMDMKGWD